MNCIQESTLSGWMASWPELETRPNLVEFITSGNILGKGISHLLFKHLGYMEHARQISDANVASFCLQCLYNRGKESITRQYSGRVENSILCEALGVLRNRFKNIRAELSGAGKFKRNPHDVVCIRCVDQPDC